MGDAIAKPDSVLGRLFEFEKRQTSTGIEVIAGISTYLALAPSYVLIPAVLSQAGIDPSAVLFATIVSSAVATLAMGFWANLPFAVSAGIEMSGFFAFVVCGTLQMSWQQGLGAVFISGLICLLFTAVRIRQDIIDAIPHGLKKAIGTSVGVFVATIGLVLAHILAFNNGRIDVDAFAVSRFWTHSAFVLYIGLGLSIVFALTRLKFPGGLLLAILVCAGLCALWGIRSTAPPELSTKMFNAIGHLQLGILTDSRFWSPIVVFFVIDFLGGIGKFIGLTSNTNIRDANDNVPRLSRALYVDGAGTVLASWLGTSSLIAFIESSVGIKAGGRTGLTAVVCAVLMSLTLVLTPLLKWIPSEGVAGVLLFVGYLLMPGIGDGDARIRLSRFDFVAASVMGVVSFLTFSLDRALAIGFWAYYIHARIVPGQSARNRIWLGSIAVVLTVIIAWQWHE